MGGKKWEKVLLNSKKIWMEIGHIPVLVEEICEWLAPRPGGVYVDCTLGAGGTTLKILEKSGKNAVVICLDRDREAIFIAKKKLVAHKSSVLFFHGNFIHLNDFVEKAGYKKVNGIVFDLGVSSFQLDQSERGFSFSQDGPLDMRMDRTQTLTAESLVNQLPEKALADLIFQYGEERYSRRIAKALVQARTVEPIRSTRSLAEVVQGAVPRHYERGRLHPATRTFQALRIAVNEELGVLEESLQKAANLLKPGGRMCVITFHSLEDRIVKHAFRALAERENNFLKILTKKPVVPHQQEIQKNPRARSAKLRVAERLNPNEEILT